MTSNAPALKLGFLADDEYEQAERLAKQSCVPLSTCPTCLTKQPEHGMIFEQPTYRFRGEERPCDCATQIALRARFLIANIGDQYMRLDWKDYDRSDEVRASVAAYLGNWQSFKQHGMGLEFGGKGLGVGKTFGATHVGKELIKHGQRVFFVPFAEMVSAFEKQDGEELERRMRETTYLILDELLPPTSDRQHSFYSTRLEALIRHRTNHNLPTIITTNMGELALHDRYPRTYSLLAAKQVRIDMSGVDARKGRIANENMELAINQEVRPIV